MDKLVLLFVGSVSQVNTTAVNKQQARAAVKYEPTPCLAVNISLLLGCRCRWRQQRGGGENVTLLRHYQANTINLLTI